MSLILFYSQVILMSAQIKRFQPKDKKEAQKRLEQLQVFLENYPEINQKKLSALLWDMKKKNNLQERNEDTFIMITPEQNGLVVDWLALHSKRRIEALRLWAWLFENVHYETGQIMLTRQELAEKVQISLNNVSRIMTELESIKAIIKEKEGRGVTYYMNPHVGTHLNQEERKKARAKAPQLELIHGGKI